MGIRLNNLRRTHAFSCDRDPYRGELPWLSHGDDADCFCGGGKTGGDREELGVKVHFFLNGAPEHVFYALIETDSVASVGRFFINGLPIVSSFKVTAVQPLEETIVMGRAMMARTGS